MRIIPLHSPSAVPLYRSLSVMIYSLPSIRTYFIPPPFVGFVTGHNDVLHGDIYTMLLKNLVMYFSVNASCISTVRIIIIQSGTYWTRRATAESGAKQSSGSSASQHQFPKSPCLTCTVIY